MPVGAKQQRTRTAQHSRDNFDAVADISQGEFCPGGSLPPIKDPCRRYACGQSLLEFLQVYFPNSTGLSPLGNDQIQAALRMEVAILEEGWIANIMPRGFIKSTMSENAVLWATLYGYEKYTLFFAGTATLSEKAIASIERELITNELLIEDFPEACIPFLALEGKAQRSHSQTYKGELTNLVSTRDCIRLARIPGFSGSGGIIEGYGLLAPPRGARYKDENGKNVRPGLAVCDDPSTDGSADSVTQNNSRLGYIKNSISMMGGHGNEMSLVVNATIIKDGDVAFTISDPDASPEWQSNRVAMVTSLPTHMESTWLSEYAVIRRDYDRTDPRGRIKAKEASTEYYRANRERMDEGAVVSWEYVGLEATEISALQHGMNIYIDKGAETFFSECQNRPVKLTSVASYEITRDVADRKSGYERFVVPASASFLTFGIDVHDNVLYYTVLATTPDFTGWIVDYGTWPEQKVTHFSQRLAKQTLSKHYDLAKKSDNERTIELGVEDLTHNILSGDWRNTNNDPVRVDAGFIDVGYKREATRNAIRRLMPASNVVLASRGIGIGPTKRPMQEYSLDSKKVVRFGPERENVRWLLPRAEQDGKLYGVQFDANYWKDMVAARLVQKAAKSRFELYGGRKKDHSHYVSHLLAETPDHVTANGRGVNVWTTKPTQDNHWFDTLVMATVAASMAGAKLPVSKVVQEPEKQPEKPRKRVASPDFGSILATARD